MTDNAEIAELREAVRRARNDLLAYGYHLEGDVQYRHADWAAHRKPGEPCRCGLDAAIEGASAALGAAPAPPALPLDVERLAEALAAAFPVMAADGTTKPPSESMGWARVIAAEYARLAEAEGSE